VYYICRWNASQHAVKPGIGSESRFLPTPPAFDAPVRGRVPVGILPCRLVRKTRMVWRWKKLWRYVYSFWLNVWTWRTDGRTDRHTHPLTAKAALDVSIARQLTLKSSLWQILVIDFVDIHVGLSYRFNDNAVIEVELNFDHMCKFNMDGNELCEHVSYDISETLRFLTWTTFERPERLFQAAPRSVPT